MGDTPLPADIHRQIIRDARETLLTTSAEEGQGNFPGSDWMRYIQRQRVRRFVRPSSRKGQPPFYTQQVTFASSGRRIPRREGASRRSGEKVTGGARGRRSRQGQMEGAPRSSSDHDTTNKSRTRCGLAWTYATGRAASADRASQGAGFRGAGFHRPGRLRRAFLPRCAGWPRPRRCHLPLADAADSRR